MSKEERRQVTQNDVAREAGVTRSLVSYVISGNTERSVAPETRKRILEVIERLGYRPNIAAQTLQQGEIAMASKKIGVLINSPDVFRRPYYAEIIEGIHTAAHENNYSVAFIRFFDELKDPVLFNSLIHEEAIGSMILISTNFSLKSTEDEKIIDKIKERIKKTVCIEWQYKGLSSVSFDRQAAGRQAVNFLIKKGHKNIVYIGENDERVDGVQQELFKNNLPAERSVFFAGECFNSEGGYECIQNYFKKNNSFPRAIVSGSDEVAIGIMCFLNENKVSIPEEVAIISMDNIEASAFTYPPLTTINVQKNGMGSSAVKMIVNYDDEINNGLPININLPTEIVERKSV